MFPRFFFWHLKWTIWPFGGNSHSAKKVKLPVYSKWYVALCVYNPHNVYFSFLYCFTFSKLLFSISFFGKLKEISDSHFIVLGLTWFKAIANAIFPLLYVSLFWNRKHYIIFTKDWCCVLDIKIKGMMKTIIIIQYLQTNGFSDTKNQEELLL